MGASSSTQQHVSSEQRELESLAASREEHVLCFKMISQSLPIFKLMHFLSSLFRTRKVSKGKEEICLTDVNHLVLSAVVSCAEVGSDFNFWDCKISELEVELPVGNFLTWTLTTVPSLADCFTEFVNARLQSSVVSEGFLAVESLISEVEVWGLGGRSVKQMQLSYKKREELFTEQSRKVDLKNFASWEDSPEKMIMDMMSDPKSSY